MSTETLAHLNTQTLIGYTSKRGNAWHYRKDEQGAEPNHYTGEIPREDVERRLFSWKPVLADVQALALDETGVRVVTDPHRQAIVRPDTNTVLGIFSKGYKVHDYQEWLVNNVEAILDADLAIGSAGLLKGGAVAWVQVEMEETLCVEGVDFRPFMTAATSMDGSLATTYQVGAQVVVCDNTLSAAMREGAAGRIKIRHSSKSLTRLHDVREALQIVHGVADEFSAAVRELTDQHVSDARWDAFVDAYTQMDNAKANGSKRTQTLANDKAGHLHRLWAHDQRVSPWRGTAYGVVAAVNTYTHHIQATRGADRIIRNTERMVTGRVDALDQNTLKVLARV